ncbi:MAG: hypothetical protein R2807_00645 [Chitinophagales bacterium]
MLQISSKPAKRAILVIFTKSTYNLLPFFDLDEKKSIHEKLNDGVQIISFSKQQKKTYLLLPIEMDATTNEDSLHEKLRIRGNTVYKTCKELKESEISIELLGNIPKEQLISILLGINLSCYEFLKYRTKQKSFNLSIHIDPIILDKESIKKLIPLRKVYK